MIVFGVWFGGFLVLTAYARDFMRKTPIGSFSVGFLGCVLGTLLSRESGAERSFHELRVRSETGMGAETAAAGPA